MRISDWSSDVCSSDLVNMAIAHLQDAPAIAQHRARLQFAEGDDLRDVIVPVLLLDITDHPAAPRFAEVDIAVRHRNAFGVEDAFEQQAQPDRIEISDRQRPGDQRARARTAPRPHRNILRLGPRSKEPTSELQSLMRTT